MILILNNKNIVFLANVAKEWSEKNINFTSYDLYLSYNCHNLIEQ